MFPATHPNTNLQYGSEFRPTKDLEPLLHCHPLWTRTKNILDNGVDVAMTPLDGETEKADTVAGVKRGNHKGAILQESTLNKLVGKDIVHGFALPITSESITKVKGGKFAPLNITTQWTIDEEGNKVQKKRLTHDQSFQGLASGISLNEQVVTSELEPLIYGHMFLRICHMIHAMRFHNPGIHIIMFKVDLDSAFRRMHLS